MEINNDYHLRKNTAIEVNAFKKKIAGATTIALGFFILISILSYLIFLRRLDIFQDSFITTFVRHITRNFLRFNLLGSFYIAFFGGLFFIFVPMEAYFINAIRHNNPFLLFFVFLSGIMMSYSLDYLIGLKISKISRKLVSPKKFYKMKSYLNKYGRYAILIGNAVPFLPSQQITFISGVFRYNKTRFFILTFSGQIIKMVAIILIVSLIIG